MHERVVLNIAFAAAGMAQGATADETQSAYTWLQTHPVPESVREAYEMIDLAFRVTKGG